MNCCIMFMRGHDIFPKSVLLDDGNNTCFRTQTGVYMYAFSGDKRDRTADLLNAMSAIREQNEF